MIDSDALDLANLSLPFRIGILTSYMLVQVRACLCIQSCTRKDRSDAMITVHLWWGRIWGFCLSCTNRLCIVLLLAPAMEGVFTATSHCVDSRTLGIRLQVYRVYSLAYMKVTWSGCTRCCLYAIVASGALKPITRIWPHSHNIPRMIQCMYSCQKSPLHQDLDVQGMEGQKVAMTIDQLAPLRFFMLYVVKLFCFFCSAMWHPLHSAFASFPIAAVFNHHLGELCMSKFTLEACIVAVTLALSLCVVCSQVFDNIINIDTIFVSILLC